VAANTNLPCSKTSHWYLNRNVKMDSNTDERLYPGTYYVATAPLANVRIV
jgi:hypothetical protein